MCEKKITRRETYPNYWEFDTAHYVNYVIVNAVVEFSTLSNTRKLTLRMSETGNT